MKQYILSVFFAGASFLALNAQPLNPPSPSSGILPVTFTSFTASDENGFASLVWNTAQETNTHIFEIEHSANGQPWILIGTVKATGNSAAPIRYSFLHTKPFKGVNLYRLKTVDIDGTWEYGETVTYNLDAVYGMKAYPASTPGILMLETTELRSPVSFTIINMEGKVIRKGNITQSKQRVQIADLSRGTYFVVTERYGAVRFSK